MAFTKVDRDELHVGDDVTVWYADGNSGQGGLVVSVDSERIVIDAPLARYEWTWDQVHHLTVDKPLPAEECLDFGPDCEGPVEYHTVGTQTRAWPRCEHHAQRRQERYENSLERWVDCDLPPAWFHGSYGGVNEYGERW